MKNRIALAVALVGIAAAAIAFSGNAQPPIEAKSGPMFQDHDSIRNTAGNFAEAFNKADAKFIANLWTENGEFRDADGTSLVGRAAIEQAYTEFFKTNPGVQITVKVKSIRFPAKNMAVEEGVICLSRGPKHLPTSSQYVTVHVREGEAWSIALSSEAGADQDRLEDVEWLFGDWSGKAADGEIKMKFEKDAAKPQFLGTITRGKSTHTARIAFDPETGGLRSWTFETDGGHSQAVWHHDGKSWLLECRGVLANGTPTSETIVIQRVAPDALTWRSIDRTLGDQDLPDTPPQRFTRVADGKSRP